jgi:2-oxoglutarate ferredoxin oxidoreductase subunit gamma
VAESAEGGRAVRHEVRLSGSGGQGIILAATLLADAAAASGREVIGTQSYGPEARGGASKAEVIIADDEIDFPEVTAPVITVCLSQEAFDAYAALTVPGGLVVYDERLVTPQPLEGRRLVGLPFTHLAETELGKAIAANIVMLGALQELTGVIGADALEDAVRRRLPAKIVELNVRALRLGHEHAAQAKPSSAPPRPTPPRRRRAAAGRSGEPRPA